MVADRLYAFSKETTTLHRPPWPFLLKSAEDFRNGSGDAAAAEPESLATLETKKASEDESSAESLADESHDLVGKE